MLRKLLIGFLLAIAVPAQVNAYPLCDTVSYWATETRCVDLTAFTDLGDIYKRLTKAPDATVSDLAIEPGNELFYYITGTLTNNSKKTIYITSIGVTLKLFVTYGADQNQSVNLQVNDVIRPGQTIRFRELVTRGLPKTEFFLELDQVNVLASR
jgi:hypothetical protein